MKRLIMMNKILAAIIGGAIALILLLALPSCKSIKKSQTEKTESATVKKSDSSSSKSYSYVDTTKTDGSTTITKTDITIDSVEWSDGLSIGYEVTTKLPGPDLSGGYNNIGISGNYLSGGRGAIPIGQGMKAKGVKITTTTIKKAAIEAKGVTIKEDVKQADIKTDEKFAKRELSKETVKKPSIKMGIGLVFGFAILAGLIWVIIWVWRKKKKAAQLVAGKIF